MAHNMYNYCDDLGMTQVRRSTENFYGAKIKNLQQMDDKLSDTVDTCKLISEKQLKITTNHRCIITELIVLPSCGAA